VTTKNQEVKHYIDQKHNRQTALNLHTWFGTSDQHRSGLYSYRPHGTRGSEALRACVCERASQQPGMAEFTRCHCL